MFGSKCLGGNIWGANSFECFLLFFFFVFFFGGGGQNGEQFLF